MAEQTVVNYWRLAILAFCDSMDQEDLARLYETVDPNDEQQVKGFIREYHLASLRRSPYWQAIRKDLYVNLRYFLTTEDFPAMNLYEDSLPAFDPPDDPLDYYRWAWEVFFGEEPYELPSLDGFVEKNDPSDLPWPND